MSSEDVVALFIIVVLFFGTVGVVSVLKKHAMVQVARGEVVCTQLENEEWWCRPSDQGDE